jgi:hypothetical protein
VRAFLVLTAAVLVSIGIGVGVMSAVTTPPSSTIASGPLHATSCANPSSWSVYNSEGLHFDYPSCWTAVHYSEESMFSSSLVDLSDQAAY